jgi:hypothetical protein
VSLAERTAWSAVSTWRHWAFQRRFSGKRTKSGPGGTKIQIGDKRQLLATEVQRLTLSGDPPIFHLSLKKFQNHRHLEASSNITYK